MPHVFFFSYASENHDKELIAFFEDLCEDVAPHTTWKQDDPNISFRDQKNLPLMEDWRPSLMLALQTSAVMVSLVSPAYLHKPFCGQEYYVFDQRRRQNLAGAPVPRVVLPVLWAPTGGGTQIFDEIQMKQDDMPETYWKKGLRYLKKSDPEEYRSCVLAFADAIQAAWTNHPTIPPLENVQEFAQIPNAFNVGEWQEAAGPGGWLPGPSVVNFVYAAALRRDLDQPQGRYGDRAAEWRPYLPPEPRTIAEISKAAAKRNKLLYREIPVDHNLAGELGATRTRKNLTLVLADPKTLPIPEYRAAVTTFDGKNWEGTALLVLCDERGGPWDRALETVVGGTFPIVTQLKAPSYSAPVTSVSELETILDTTFTGLRGALTMAEVRNKEKTDDGPPQVSAKPEDPAVAPVPAAPVETP